MKFLQLCDILLLSCHQLTLLNAFKSVASVELYVSDEPQSGNLNPAVSATLWFDSMIYQVQMNKPQRATVYTFNDPSPIGEYCTDYSDAKIMINNNGNSVYFDWIKVTTDTGTWYGIDAMCVSASQADKYYGWDGWEHWVLIQPLCPEGYALAHFCVDNTPGNCDPYKQIFYFDVSKANQLITDSRWESGLGTVPQTATCDPTTDSPASMAPTHAPSNPQPNTSDPTTADPITTTDPTAPDAITADPTTIDQTTSEPTTTDPTSSEPTTSEPTTADPTTSYPTTSEPTTVDPTSSEPTTSDPTTSKPSSDPTTSESTTRTPTAPNKTPTLDLRETEVKALKTTATDTVHKPIKDANGMKESIVIVIVVGVAVLVFCIALSLVFVWCWCQLQKKEQQLELQLEEKADIDGIKPIDTKTYYVGENGERDCESDTNEHSNTYIDDADCDHESDDSMHAIQIQRVTIGTAGDTKGDGVQRDICNDCGKEE
eukprot:373925_1